MQAISEKLYQEAEKYIPGGVNSPVRAYRSVGGTPRFIAKANGAYLTDVDGNTYIDYVGSWGPMILGHNHPAILEAVEKAIKNGLSFGAPCEQEVHLARLICERIDSIDQVRMVNSGTEATMSALRLARGFTGKNKIIKFEGNYHGHADFLLVKAGSGALTFGSPSSAGVPNSAVADTLIAHYNDLDSVEQLFLAHPNDIAALIVEPYPGNMNFILPNAGFLEGLRALCDHYQTVLIFDEVMTGFRVGPQGVQSHTTVRPDLTTLGKIIGGGMPVGAYGGKKEIMAKLSPLGPVYQAGTLSGNPVAMAAGIAALETLAKPNTYSQLTKLTTELIEGILHCAKKANIPMVANFSTGMFGVFFTEQTAVTSFDAVMKCHVERFKTFFHALLARGIYLAPSAFEAGFVSLAHTEADIQKTLSVVEEVLTHHLS